MIKCISSSAAILIHDALRMCIGVGGGGGGGRGSTVPPPPKKNLKTKNAGKSSGKFGQKQWEIRKKTIEHSGKSNGKLGEKQWEIRAKAIIFARNICRRFPHCFCPNFPIPFAEFFHCFCPNFPIAFARICHCFFPKFGQSNGKIGAKIKQ